MFASEPDLEKNVQNFGGFIPQNVRRRNCLF